MKIIVTGGCGFIGSHFVEQAVTRGDEILVIDKLTYAGSLDNLAHLPKDSFKFSHVDISNSQTLSKEIKQFGKADCLINFAAESHVDRSISNPAPFMESNIIGTVNLLELLRSSHFDRMVQISTDEVYGSINEGSWNEFAPILPRSSYSASKASAEHFCRAYRNTYGLSIAITRCSNNYGERQSAEKLIPKIISSVLAELELPIYGGGVE